MAIEEQFEAWKSAVNSQLADLDANYQTWEAINNLNLNPERFNTAPYFWDSARRTYIERLILGLWSGVADGKKKSASLRKLLDFCTEHQIELFEFSNVRRRVIGRKQESDADEIRDLENLTRRNSLDAMGLEQLSVSLNAARKSLQGWRNKVLAHRELAYVIGSRSVSDDYPLTPGEIRKVIDESWDVLRTLDAAYSNVEFMTGVFSSIPSEIESLTQ
ncbi:MAG: hypothetical protein QF554_10405 [Dehalococcoidia bacterium]|nr:hypothetical protein [Dehalococcoidia bacterium]